MSEKNEKKELDDADSKTPKFTLEGNRYHAKCVIVYDADSVNVVFKWHGKLTRWATRLYGINAPEVRGGSIEERKKGIAARDWVREKILGKEIWIKCYKFEKYGRLLCDIYLDDTFKGPTLSDMLIENKMAEPYMID